MVMMIHEEFQRAKLIENAAGEGLSVRGDAVFCRDHRRLRDGYESAGDGAVQFSRTA
jgi:hypothetical protein